MTASAAIMDTAACLLIALIGRLGYHVARNYVKASDGTTLSGNVRPGDGRRDAARSTMSSSGSTRARAATPGP